MRSPAPQSRRRFPSTSPIASWAGSPSSARRGGWSRHLAQWAAAAGVAGLALLAVALWKGPGFDAMVASLGLTTAGLVNAAAKLVAPANAVANGLGRAMTALAGSAQTLLQPLAPFQPLARVLLVALTAGMLGITTFIVGRDVRGRAADEEHA